MSESREVMTRALNELKSIGNKSEVWGDGLFNAIEALEAALSKPEQEPVMYGNLDEIKSDAANSAMPCTDWYKTDFCSVPLFTTPQPLTRLSDDEVDKAYENGARQTLRPQDSSMVHKVSNAIQDALIKKNGG